MTACDASLLALSHERTLLVFSRYVVQADGLVEEPEAGEDVSLRLFDLVGAAGRGCVSGQRKRKALLVTERHTTTEGVLSLRIVVAAHRDSGGCACRAGCDNASEECRGRAGGHVGPPA
jgi:hypothetical protein